MTISTNFALRSRRAFVVLLSFLLPIMAPAESGVLLKLAPPETVIMKGDTVLKYAKGENGSRLYALNAGNHELTLSAPGYAPKSITVKAGDNKTLYEEKLERVQTSLRFVRYIPTLPRPKSVEFTPDGKRLIVAPLSGKTIEAFDIETGERVAAPTLPEKFAKQEGFVESAFLPDRDELWVSQMHSSMIHIFRLSDCTYLESVPCGGNFPKVITVHPDGLRVFISNWISESVSVLDVTTRKRLAAVKMTGIPRGMAVSSDKNTLFAANFETGTLDRIDLATYAHRPALLGGGAKRHTVLDSANGKIYVSDMYTALISRIDEKSGKLEQSAKVSLNPNTIKLSPDGKHLYVTTRGPNNPVDYELKGPLFGELLVIDTESMKIVERHWGGNQPTGLCVSPDGNTVVFSDFLDHRLEIYQKTSAP